MQTWLKMALKITLFSLPGIVLIAIVVTYIVHAQKSPTPKYNNFNANVNGFQNPVTFTPPHNGYQPPVRTSYPVPVYSRSPSTPSPSSASSTSGMDTIPPSCPPSMFKCSIKSNSLFQIRSRHRGFVCIDNARVCDGKVDCAMSEDELNCNRENADELDDCYLCRNTNGACIENVNLCDGVPDCPEEDDELPQNCLKNALSKDKVPVPVNVGGSSELTHGSQSSSFKSEQTGNANITIVNQRGLSSSDPDDRDRKPNQAPTAGTGSVSGVGFNFQVENFVIYNSQVKMFNQDSENVALAGNKHRSYLDKIKEHQNPANISNGPPPGATTSAPSSHDSDFAPPLSQTLTPPPSVFQDDVVEDHAHYVPTK